MRPAIAADQHGWKNAMHAPQTAKLPRARSSALAIIGWISKSKNALRNAAA
jgi:hypothetical protein